jgi:hypothetical protein
MRGLIDLAMLAVPPRGARTSAAAHYPSLRDDLRHLLMQRAATLRASPESALPSPPTISSLDDAISVLASQVHPKKLMLIASTGERLNYLCKKDDALRKDMHMMELTSFVHHILLHHRQCHPRDLAVMTFAVVCLNERYAMIEWVDPTRALRAIVEELLCDGMANAPHICRTRYKSFVPHILPAFPRLMHMWFVAHFKVIARWFQTRLWYTRSVDGRLGARAGRQARGEHTVQRAQRRMSACRPLVPVRPRKRARRAGDGAVPPHPQHRGRDGRAKDGLRVRRIRATRLCETVVGFAAQCSRRTPPAQSPRLIRIPGRSSLL